MSPSFRIKRFALLVLAAGVAASVALAAKPVHRAAAIGSGYYAKMLCSGVFVSGRPEDRVIAEDVLADQDELLGHFEPRIDRDAQSVTVSLFGAASSTAYFREGLGCALGPISGPQLRPDRTMTAPADPDAPWPAGNRVELATTPGLNRTALDAAIAAAFDEPNPNALKRTRSLIVVHNGQIVAERHAEGFGPDTPQLGWSMSKSVMNALIGRLVAEGRLTVDREALLPAWNEPGDTRRSISLDHLLRMVSGLRFDESYDGMWSDVRTMLFAEQDVSQFAASKPLSAAPGKVWSYSSGTSNILARVLYDTLGRDPQAALDFPYRELFGPLHMQTALFETDAANIFVGSSYVYASARDWARLGLFYLRDGVWEGRRLLPEGWVAYSTQETPGSGGEFGAHLWLTAPTPQKDEAGARAGIPEDDFYMLGHDGQMVAMIPSKDLVIVRLGLSRKPEAFDNAALVRSITAAFE